MSITIVVADDQALVRSGLTMILATQPDVAVVGEAADGHAAVDLVRVHHPDIVLMDIRMPGVDGLAATRAIAVDPTLAATKVVMLTTYDLDEYLFGALRAGAAGFLLKGIAPEDLIHAVREIAAGGSLLAPSATRRLIAEFINHQVGQPDEGAGKRIATLTPRELEVLSLMSRGLSNGEIADMLIVGENTVKTHVGHILTKLDARDRVQAVIAAYNAGIAEPTPADDAGQTGKGASR